MDFLKAFEQAQTLGITKEEFISVWESESKLKMVINAGEMNSPYTEYRDLKQAGQNKNSDGHGSSVDTVVVNKIETRQEAKEDHNFVPEHLYKQLIDKYEQLWQQMHLKYDQLLKEFHSHFEILSNHISNVGEAQANSLKLYFMHEIDLLKQDLRRLIEEQNMRSETTLIQPVMSTQQTGVVNLQDSSTYQSVISQPNSSSSRQISSGSNNQINHNKPNHNYFQQNQEAFQLQAAGNLAQPGYDYPLDGDRGVVDTRQKGLLRPENSFADILKNAPVKSKVTAGAIPAIAKNAPMNYACALDTSTDRHPGQSYAVPLLNLNKRSVVATGLFADTIANQMKHRQSSQAGSVKSTTNSVKSEPAQITTGKKKKAKSSISNTSHEFTVDTLSHLTVSEPFLSPYVYSTGKRCKARLVLKVEGISCLLTVHLRVSKGEFDDSHKWPVTLKGSGYIFNPGSKSFTPLWQFTSVICQKPTSREELIFPAEVCLMTSKRNLKDVTLPELLKRYKVEEGSLTFLWDLRATEKQMVAEN